jgi:hypothetical protein
MRRPPSTAGHQYVREEMNKADGREQPAERCGRICPHRAAAAAGVEPGSDLSVTETPARAVEAPRGGDEARLTRPGARRDAL